MYKYTSIYLFINRSDLLTLIGNAYCYITPDELNEPSDSTISLYLHVSITISDHTNGPCHSSIRPLEPLHRSS